MFYSIIIEHLIYNGLFICQNARIPDIVEAVLLY